MPDFFRFPHIPYLAWPGAGSLRSHRDPQALKTAVRGARQAGTRGIHPDHRGALAQQQYRMESDAPGRASL